jgi:hypothetical protein
MMKTKKQEGGLMVMKKWGLICIFVAVSLAF